MFGIVPILAAKIIIFCSTKANRTTFFLAQKQKSRTTVYLLSQMTEQILRKQPNEIIINDRTKSSQTTEKVSNNLCNSIIISIFAAKLSNKRKITICINQE